MDATWDFPITMYQRDYKTAKITDAGFIIKESSEGGKYKGNKCFDSTCDSHFYVTYGQQYFLVVNWSKTETARMPFEIVDFAS